MVQLLFSVNLVIYTSFIVSHVHFFHIILPQCLSVTRAKNFQVLSLFICIENNFFGTFCCKFSLDHFHSFTCTTVYHNVYPSHVPIFNLLFSLVILQINIFRTVFIFL